MRSLVFSCTSWTVEAGTLMERVPWEEGKKEAGRGKEGGGRRVLRAGKGETVRGRRAGEGNREERRRVWRERTGRHG